MKYRYQIVAAFNNTKAETYHYEEANSLRVAVERLSALAESNSDLIDQKVFRNEFRKPTMIKVGFNVRKPNPDENASYRNIESSYTIFRYADGKPVPAAP